jgi:hypothetical protein
MFNPPSSVLILTHFIEKRSSKTVHYKLNFTTEWMTLDELKAIKSMAKIVTERFAVVKFGMDNGSGIMEDLCLFEHRGIASAPCPHVVLSGLGLYTKALLFIHSFIHSFECLMLSLYRPNCMKIGKNTTANAFNTALPPVSGLLRAEPQ